MNEFLAEWLLLIIVHGAALISPGPDFVMAVKNSVLYSRKTGILNALGFSVAVAVHLTYCLIGLAAIISQSIVIYSMIKYAGAAYLIYIGIKSLRSKGFKGATETHQTRQTLSNWAAFRGGFITNLLNPKAAIYFLALFTQIIAPDTPSEILALYSATCTLLTFAWFSGVATILTHAKIQTPFLMASQWVERICGTLLIALGLKLILDKK